MGFKTARKKAGKTADEVAEALGVSRQAVFGWERGEYFPETGKLVALADFYGCSIDALLREDVNNGQS